MNKTTTIHNNAFIKSYPVAIILWTFINRTHHCCNQCHVTVFLCHWEARHTNPKPTFFSRPAPWDSCLLYKLKIGMSFHRFTTTFVIQNTATESPAVITNRFFRVPWTNGSVFVSKSNIWCDWLNFYININSSLNFACRREYISSSHVFLYKRNLPSFTVIRVKLWFLGYESFVNFLRIFRDILSLRNLL
jgi:hypothetical protein